MNRTTLRRTALVGFLLAAVPAATATAIAIAKPAAVASPTPVASATPSAADAQHLTNLKTRGAAEIDRRTTNLNAALAKLSASKKLSASDKSTLSTQVQAELTNLAALKAKLAADTDVASARTDVASVVTDYRVYTLMLPKVRLITATDQFALVEADLAALQPQLQTKVDAAKAAGTSVTTMQASLDDMQTKTTAAGTLTSGLAAELLVIQPSDYNTNHAVLTGFRTKLQTARTDVQAAAADAKSVVSALGTSSK